MSSNPPGTITVPTVVTAWEVESAVIATLWPRLSYYVEQLGWSPPRSVSRMNVFNKEDEKQLPAIIVVCAGLADLPAKYGDGNYIARWLVGVGVIVSARKEEEARRMARDYGAMIRATLLQQPSLGGFARAVDWIDEAYDQLDQDRHRSLATSEIMFHIEVGHVVNARELPFMPDMLEIPTPSGYTAEEVVNEVEQMGGS